MRKEKYHKLLKIRINEYLNGLKESCEEENIKNNFKFDPSEIIIECYSNYYQ